MRIIIVLLVVVAACLVLTRTVFAGERFKRHRTFFHALALVFGVMLAYIAVMAMVQGEFLF